jgi:hypothetical protein
MLRRKFLKQIKKQRTLVCQLLGVLKLKDYDFQYSKTNVMQFVFSLLRIKGLYMFRELLAHPQEALHKRHLVYCVRVMSVGCTGTGLELRHQFHSNHGAAN